MAFGSIELTTVSRAQDYSAIKHNEDSKPMVDQSIIGQEVQKTTQQRIREVHSSDNADWYEKKPDAKEKGNGTYAGDGGKRRRKPQQKDQVVVKGQGGFDMKI